MKGKLATKVFSGAMALVLTVGLGPGLALAAPVDNASEGGVPAVDLNLSTSPDSGLAMETQAYYYPSIVTAPLVDYATGEAVAADPADYDVDSSVYYTSSTATRYFYGDGKTKNDTTLKAAQVKLSASNLGKIKQAADGEAAYVAGFGLQAVDGDQFAIGYGAVPAEPEFTAASPFGTFEKDGKTYNAFYFSNANSFTGVKGYVAVKHASGNVTTYNVDLTDVYTNQELARGFYKVTSFKVDDKVGYDGMILVDPNDAPAYIKVADGQATLILRVYNANKYDYIWMGKVADRPDSSATDQMVKGFPVPADEAYIAGGLQKSQVFTDSNAVYGGAQGIKYKAMYFELPITQADIAEGKAYFSIRRTPGLTNKGGEWMGESEHYFDISGVEAAATALDLTSLSFADVADAAEATILVPDNATSDDMGAYANAYSAYIAYDYSPSDYAPRVYLDTVLPEIAGHLRAADASIPNVIPADGTYLFSQTLISNNYPSIAEGFVSDSLYSGKLVVENGKMTVTVSQRRGSYNWLGLGFSSQLKAAEDAAGGTDKMAGVFSFKDETEVYLDHAQGTEGPDGAAASDAAGMYKMYTTTFELQSLEKPIPMAFKGSSWYNRSFIFHASNLYKADVLTAMRAIDPLLNSPDPNDPDNVYVPYKVDPTLLTAESQQAAQNAVAAYNALDEAGKAQLAETLTLSTPAGAEDGQTYTEALALATGSNVSTVELEQASLSYTGNALEPVVTVKSAEGAVLTAGTDYDVNYADNINAGTATITVTGKGLHAGTATATFEIAKAASTVTLSNKTATYTGQTINIGAAKVTGSTGKVTYAYYTDKACTKKASAHKNAGTYYVKATVAADANYAAATSAAAKLTINKKANTLNVKPVKATQSVKYNVKTTLKAAKVFKVTKNVSKGTVTYKKTSGNKKITVASNGNVTVAKGLAKSTYTVKVKAASKAMTNYKSATANVSFKVKVQ